MNLLSEIGVFLVHLRIHYQLLVLSGGYLLGGLFVPDPELEPFVAQFFNVHILLNGGITAYNSYWDDDDGPIGGIEHPPKMKRWMHPASILVQGIGLAFAWKEGAYFVALWVLTMFLSAFYSGPPRWKGHPVGSLVCVGVGTGTNTFLMGYLAAGGAGLSLPILGAAVGTAALLLSLYPVSQIFQLAEDRARGDRTFAVVYGTTGIHRFYVAAYGFGLGLLAASLFSVRPTWAVIVAVVGIAAGALTWRVLSRLSPDRAQYHPVMRLKYGASLSFVLFLIAAHATVALPVDPPRIIEGSGSSACGAPVVVACQPRPK